MQTVHLFVFDTLADWEASYAIARIHTPAMPGAAGRYRVQTVGITKEPVTTMGGVRILPDLTLEELDLAASALLILPGGDRWDVGELSEVMPYVARFLAAGVPIAAICGATAGLARAGFLDAVRHTSNAVAYLQATGYRGAAHYEEAGAVVDGVPQGRRASEPGGVEQRPEAERYEVEGGKAILHRPRASEPGGGERRDRRELCLGALRTAQRHHVWVEGRCG